MRLLFWSTSALAITAAVFLACRDNPTIDGSKVGIIASPTCPQACDRLAQLCGYPPSSCEASCKDYDDVHRTCIGSAPSCQAALESCANEERDGGEEDAGEEEDAGSEGGEEDAEADADAADAASQDDASDASDASDD